MRFHSVRIFNLRNLQNASISLEAGRIHLVGPNGQGKTNFLESIYLLCFGSSFRTKLDRELVRHGEHDMSVSGTLEDGTTIALKVERGRKTIEVNGKRIADRKELIENVPCIVFCHEDIEFIQGPPERRRWFFNQTMSLHTPLFVDVIRSYSRVIRMRNAALKDQSGDLYQIYDQQTASLGVELQQRRRDAVEQFDKTFTRLFRVVSGIEEPLHLRYFPSWKGVESVEGALAALASRRGEDLTMRTTVSGPHRDRISYYLGSRNFSRIASTGQKRLMSLILRVAQASYFSEATGKKPVLLLDDVLLELDPERRRRFLDVLPEADQVFFTFLPDEQYHTHRAEETLVFAVKDGVLSAS